MKLTVDNDPTTLSIVVLSDLFPREHLGFCHYAAPWFPMQSPFVVESCYSPSSQGPRERVAREPGPHSRRDIEPRFPHFADGLCLTGLPDGESKSTYDQHSLIVALSFQDEVRFRLVGLEP